MVKLARICAAGVNRVRLVVGPEHRKHLLSVVLPLGAGSSVLVAGVGSFAMSPGEGPLEVLVAGLAGGAVVTIGYLATGYETVHRKRFEQPMPTPVLEGATL